MAPLFDTMPEYESELFKLFEINFNVHFIGEMRQKTFLAQDELINGNDEEESRSTIRYILCDMKVPVIAFMIERIFKRALSMWKDYQNMEMKLKVLRMQVRIHVDVFADQLPPLTLPVVKDYAESIEDEPKNPVPEANWEGSVDQDHDFTYFSDWDEEDADEEYFMDYFDPNSLTSDNMVPATQISITTLEKVKIDQDSVKECVICFEEFFIGMKATRMPCTRPFHGECISRWLERNNLCPLCRFQMPTLVVTRINL